MVYVVLATAVFVHGSLVLRLAVHMYAYLVPFQRQIDYVVLPNALLCVTLSVASHLLYCSLQTHADQLIETPTQESKRLRCESKCKCS